MDGLVDGTLVGDVAGSGEAETTDESSAEIRDDITIEIWHNHNVEDLRVLRELHAYSVNLLFSVLDVSVFQRDFLASVDEETIALLHHTGLVASYDALAVLVEY